MLLRKTALKVCIIAPTFPYMSCGVGDYSLELAMSLAGAGLEVGVITSKHEKIEDFIRNNSMQKISLFPVIKHWDISNISCFLRTVDNFKPDIIHIQYHWWITNHGFLLKGIMAVLLPLILKMFRIKIPILTTLHSRLNGPYLFPKAGLLRRWALLPLLLFSDKIVVTNKFDRGTISQWLPFLKKKVEYTAGGTGHYLKADGSIRTEALNFKAGFKGAKSNEVILSNFGFMVSHKGIEELLEAMYILRKKGYSLKLLAIGGFDIEINSSSSYFSKLQKIAGRFNLTPYIKWTGFCDSRQASLFLLASDICVMPFLDGASEWRSSFLDALSHELPVVTTCTRKTPEELVNRVNCILVPPGDPHRLAGAIEELINSPELRNSLGRAAGELYNIHYHWPVIAKKTSGIYMELLKRKAGYN